MKTGLLASALWMVGCASIVSEKTYTVAIDSVPNGANFVIENREGETVHSGKTPASVTLQAGAGYFKGEQYTLTLTKAGYPDRVHTLRSKVDGWYWGNILFGGPIGFLIVDPLTGAMYTLPETVLVPLHEPENTDEVASTHQLTVIALDQLSDSQREQLVPLTQ